MAKNNRITLGSNVTAIDYESSIFKIVGILEKDGLIDKKEGGYSIINPLLLGEIEIALNIF